MYFIHAIARTHLPNELLDSLVDGILLKVELRGDPLCLFCEGHAALWPGIEGSDEFDLLLRLGAEGRFFLEEDGVAKGDARRGHAPMLVLGEEKEDRVREVGC